MDTFLRFVAVMGTVGRLPSTPAWGFGHGEGLQRIAVGKPAIALVRSVRPGAIETWEQENHVRSLACAPSTTKA